MIYLIWDSGDYDEISACTMIESSTIYSEEDIDRLRREYNKDLVENYSSLLEATKRDEDQPLSKYSTAMFANWLVAHKGFKHVGYSVIRIGV